MSIRAIHYFKIKRRKTENALKIGLKKNGSNNPQFAALPPPAH